MDARFHPRRFRFNLSGVRSRYNSKVPADVSNVKPGLELQNLETGPNSLSISFSPTDLSPTVLHCLVPQRQQVHSCLRALARAISTALLSFRILSSQSIRLTPSCPIQIHLKYHLLKEPFLDHPIKRSLQSLCSTPYFNSLHSTYHSLILLLFVYCLFSLLEHTLHKNKTLSQVLKQCLAHSRDLVNICWINT